MIHPDAGMTHFGIDLSKNDLNLRHKKRGALHSPALVRLPAQRGRRDYGIGVTGV